MNTSNLNLNSVEVETLYCFKNLSNVCCDLSTERQFLYMSLRKGMQ